MKRLSLMSYLGFVWALFVCFCIAPAESFALETTQYARVVAQAERIAYLAAQRSSLASHVATAALAPSATSLAVRMVAGPVGWAALGVGAGLVLAQMYYSQADLLAVKTAASTTVCAFCTLAVSMCPCSILVLVGTVCSCELLCDSVSVVSGSRGPRQWVANNRAIVSRRLSWSIG